MRWTPGWTRLSRPQTIQQWTLQSTRRLISVGITFSLALCLAPVTAQAQDILLTVERYVPHVSTVPATDGDSVRLYLREKLPDTLAADMTRGERPDGKVVLFVHGGSVPSVPDYDLPFEDYSWMGFLAEAGYDTFAMDHTGYGRSPRPEMNNPCNMDEQDQSVVTPNPLAGPCMPSYAFGLTTVESDWDEIDTVVDYILNLRNVERVSLVGWSAGGRRVGGYAARHPEKVDKLVLYAPGYDPDGSSLPTADIPEPGVPMRLQTRETLEQGRWQSNVACENQLDPRVRDAVWQSIMGFDTVGASWGPPGGVMRVRAGNSGWGWNEEYAAKVEAPTLILVGAEDNPEVRGVLYDDLTSAAGKVLVTMACATHFAVWETAQYKFMHQASLEWLEHGTYRGHEQGRYEVGYNGATETAP